MNFNCPCGERYEMLPSNTQLYTYTAESKYNWFETECAKCEEVHAFFFDDDPDNILIVLKRIGCSNTRKALAEEQVKDLYETIHAKEDTPIYDLTPRQEAEIAKLARDLEAVPDEWIQEIFSHPPPRSDLPKRWA